MKHSDHDPLRPGGDGTHDELFSLLDRQEAPAPELQQRFEARLQQTAVPAMTPVPGRLASLFQRYWPSRPAWAFAYSCCLLVAGLFAGQWLPDGTSATPQTTSALICPVMSAPGEWLPALEKAQLA